MQRSAAACTALVGTALVVAGLSPWHAGSQLALHVQNATHPLGFAVASVVLLVAFAGLAASVRRTRRASVAVGAALLVLGALIELVQGRFGRTASLSDVAGDAAGIACGVLVVWSVVALRKGVPLVALLASFGAAAALGVGLWPHLPYFVAAATRPAFPIIEDFSGALALERVGVSSRSRARLVPSPDGGPGARALELVFGAERWSAIWLADPPADWRCAAALSLTLRNPGRIDLPVNLRVHDALHDDRPSDRFGRRLSVPPGTTTFTTPMDEIASMGQLRPARPMALGRISGVMLVGDPGLAGRALEIGEIRLEPGRPSGSGCAGTGARGAGRRTRAARTASRAPALAPTGAGGRRGARGTSGARRTRRADRPGPTRPAAASAA